MKKSLIAILMAIIMSFSMIACAESDRNFNEEGFPIVNEPITLDIMINYRDSDTSYTPPKDLPLFQELEELTGIKADWNVIWTSDWDTKLNLMLASGEYPDVIFGGIDVEKYGVDEKVIIPLDELLEKYAPIITGRIAREKTDPTIAQRASDGQMYSIGFFISQKIKNGNVHFINQAWLDALNLEMPNDIESLTEVLRAFKSEDPNGDGLNNEIPYVTIVNTNGGNDSILQSLALFGVPYNYRMIYIDDEKKVQFIPTQQGFRDLMEWTSLLYREELIDIDAFSQDTNTAMDKIFASQLAGFFSEWRLLGRGYRTGGADKDCVLYMQNDAVYEKTIELSSSHIFITCADEYPEATVRWLDTLHDTENMFTLYYGPKKETNDGTPGGWYYDVNGKITNSKWGDTTPKVMMNTNGPFFMPGVSYTEVFNLEDSRLEKIDYSDRMEQAGLLQKYSNSYLTLCKFSLEDNERLNDIAADIYTAVNEYMVEFVQNGVTDEKWDEFVKTCQDIGCDEYVEIYQEALDEIDVK